MKKLIVKCLAFLLIIGGLTASFLISKPKQVVKADTPSTYYFDFDTSHENYISIIVYILDAYSLRNNTCNLRVYAGKNSPPYQATYDSFNIQFLRYSFLDHNDYSAYIYNLNYYSTSSTKYMISVSTTSLQLDDNTFISYDIYLPYYPTFKTYYDNGYDHGYQDGTNDRNAYWEDYIEETYLSTTGSGYQQIYGVGRQAGFIAGQDSLNTMEWFETTASGVNSILQLKLLPSITIGALIFIPLMFLILKGVLWIWRRN